jgi:hypothetical protein
MGILKARSGKKLRVWRLLAGLAGSLALALACSHAASATTIHPYYYSENFFDGSGSTGGPFGGPVRGPAQLSIDQHSESVYVNVNESIAKFTFSGAPSPFSDPSLVGGNELPVGARNVNLTVDNTSASTAGNLYVEVTPPSASPPVRAFASSGAELQGTGFPLGGFSQNCGVAVDPEGDIWIADSGSDELIEFSPDGTPKSRISVRPVQPCQLEIDGNGNFYTGERPDHVGFPVGPVRKYSPSGQFLYMLDPGWTRAIAIDYSNNNVFVDHGGDISEYDSNGALLDNFGTPDPAHSYPGLGSEEQQYAYRSGGIAVNSANHDLYVSDEREYGGTLHVEIFKEGEGKVVPTVVAQAANPTVGGATLHGTVDADGGGDTADCYFEWGAAGEWQSPVYPETVPCSPSGPFSGTGPNPVTAQLTGLSKGTTYHYRLVAKNANGVLAKSNDIAFQPQGPASIVDETLSDVNTDSARFSFDVDPNGGDTSYHVEIGTAPCSANPCTSVPLVDPHLPETLGVQHASQQLGGLNPGTTYYARIVVTNALGSVKGLDYVFRTYDTDVGGIDPCPNAYLRQQTRSTGLLDCRAFELVSARDAGGYDVESDLVPGQTPLVAQPRAVDKVVYSLHFGTIPGIAGSPTNFGLDAYVASRDQRDGWSTKYVGIPAKGTPSTTAFGSLLEAADQNLSAFAFGGDGICSPCFADGTTGIPVRLPDGSLVQGMAGSLDPGPADQDGLVLKRLSADGTHLIFGSTAQFEPDGNQGGDTSIYERDLQSGTTQVVSKTPAGANLPCLGGLGTCHAPGDAHGIASLDVSADGSRVVVAQRISTDSNGNDYWHPYIHIGASQDTLDLAPGTTSGVRYVGMSADGTEVYFTTKDQLLAGDTDSSADLYRADVSSTSVTLSLISTGTSAGNTDSCDPVPGAGENWNEVGSSSPENCSVTAVAGGGGVARDGGAVYFLSPEKLDGGSSGTQDWPNLYLARPGSSPKFVATLEPDNRIVRSWLTGSALPGYGYLQVTPNGGVAIFDSQLPLTGYPNDGHSEIYRFGATDNSLDCVSCAPTGATATASTALSPFGSNLTDDGRVFFTTADGLVLRDTNHRKDAYEWSGGTVELISTGTGLEDSGLLSVSADGVNAYFFTHESLVPQDANGSAMKIYDARVDGGIPYNPPAPPCEASDECHGPGTAAAAPPDIGTYQGTGGQFAAKGNPTAGRCKRPRVKRHGRCVKVRKPPRKGNRHHG